nr:hypothetical protein [Tanacetum cinerariifolium]
MKAIQDATTAGTIPPKIGRQILAEITRSTNRAHIAGVGRNLVGKGNLDSGMSQSVSGYCTQEQLEDLKRQQALENDEQRKAFEINKTPKKICGFLQPSTRLGNYYTLTFDPQTSQSDQQDDNDSDDGNREYDVDIHNDE